METERISLRPWLDSDAETLFKYASDPDVGPRAGWPPHKSVEESLEIIRNVFNKDTTTWAIVLKATGEVIGAMGYGASCNCKMPTRDGEPIVGYWVAKPYWNQGICTEALQLMLDHIRKATNIKSLLCGHFVDNPASGRVMEKCGFVPTGEMCYDESMYMGEGRPIRVLRLELKKQPPIIGVTPLWDAERKSLWMLPDYLDGIKAAGGLPIVLPFDMTDEDADRIVETCDGFLFTGGQDVGSCPERDKLETLLLSKALPSDKPILGICRGLQFINVFLGGTLWQDLPSQHPSEIVHRQGKPYGMPSHTVTLSGNLSTLLGKNTIEVNTLHHQAAKDLGSDLTAMAVAPDGIIEAFQMKGKRFVWGVQWHPEYLFRTDPHSLAIFSCFVRQCK